MQISILHPTAFEKWDYTTPERTGIGGSETSQIELAWRLARRGHDVVSYAPLRDDTVPEWRGTVWKNLESVEHQRQGIWFVYRSPECMDMFQKEHPGQRVYFIAQDVDYPSWNAERWAKVDRFVAICQTHAQYTRKRYPKFADKVMVAANGLKVDLIEQVEPEGIVRNPRKLIFASSPDRGLLNLLRIFRRSREWIHDLELHTYYGFDNMDKLIEGHANTPQGIEFKNCKETILREADQPGVIMHGRMTQPELYREWLSAGIWCHPSTFTETGCITCIEAQALGAIPITNPIWAVGEYVMHGIFIQGDPACDPLVNARYVGQLYALASQPAEQDKIRPDMMADARRRFDWERTVDVLESDFLKVETPSEVQSRQRFILYSPTHMERWDWNNAETGIGGCETAVTEMAWRLAARGCEVIVYTQTPFHGEREWRGTKWRPVESADFSLSGTWALYRCPNIVGAFDPSRDDQTLWLMMQDWDYEWNPKIVEQLDRIITLSECHKQFMVERHPELIDKLCITSHGVKVDLIREIEQEQAVSARPPERNPNKIMWASSPDRGLLRLFDIFAIAREKNPALNLHVFYGFDGIELLVKKHPQFQSMMPMVEDIKRRAAEIGGIVLRGRVTQKQLYQEWLTSGLWVYPTDFFEMNCITAQEAQAMGAYPIVMNIHAQAEKTVIGALMDLDDTDLEWAQIIEMKSGNADIDRQEIMLAARHEFDWENSVNDWIRFADREPLVKEVTRCRLCGGELVPVLSFGEQSIATKFPLPGEAIPTAPLRLDRCLKCDVGQLSNTVNRHYLFGSQYGYRSGMNATMRFHLEDVAHSVIDQVKPGEIVVDIGANDGTLLDFFPESIIKVGFEPNWLCPTGHIREFFSQRAFEQRYLDRKAKVVFSLAMFYSVEDPRQLAREVRSILADDGVWVIELQDFGKTYDNNSFDTICHEHVTYWDWPRLARLLMEEGFDPGEPSANSINGGSLQVHARKASYVINNDVGAGPWHEFSMRCHQVKADLLVLLGQLPKDLRVWGYGASTKGNVLLQYCGLDSRYIEKIADKNPLKWGRVTPGTGIPIVSEDEMRKVRPEYLLALPWAFMDEFREREPWATWIVPFPQPRIVLPVDTRLGIGQEVSAC